MDNVSHFTRMIQKFIEQDPARASHLMESMDASEVARILPALPLQTGLRVIRRLQVSFAAAVLENAVREYVKSLMPQLDPQFLTAVLMHTSEHFREQIKEDITRPVRDQIRDLLTYPEGSIGRIITTDFIAFDKDMLVRDAVAKIRSLAKTRSPASYAYVVDEDRHLVGVLNMRDLMIASPGQTLESVMRTDVFFLHSFTDIREAAADLSKRKYFAAPVVDSDHCIIGIIKAERLIKGVQENTSQDIQRMFGAGGDEKPFSPLLFP